MQVPQLPLKHEIYNAVLWFQNSYSLLYKKIKKGARINDYTKYLRNTWF